MKRFIALLLAALMSLSLLSACAERTEPTQPTPTPTAAPTPTPTPAPTPTPTPTPAPADDELVRVKDYIPDIITDLKYATTDNFTGVVIYDDGTAYLRYGTVKKLAAAQRELAEDGYSLLIWDAYRPVSAQYRLWEVCPNPVYVADPTKGFSKHSRGNTVDISLVSTNGDPVEMPSGFDDFTSRADRDYSDVSQTAGENARYLEAVMTAAGFVGYSGEWWHYSDSTAYPVVQ